jgi:hypothetical protein
MSMDKKNLTRAIILFVWVVSFIPLNRNVFAAAVVPPGDLFQLPWDLGVAWMAIDGIDDGSKRPTTSSHYYLNGGAIDFAPRSDMITGEDTSNYWVTAAAGGTVKEVSSCHVKIEHAGGWTTEYQFLGKVQVKMGDAVTRNQRLGIIADGVRYKYCVGYEEPNTPHLHFMLRPSIIGATFAGWQVKYSSFWNSTSFSKGGTTVGLYKPLMNDFVGPTRTPSATNTAAPSATFTLTPIFTSTLDSSQATATAVAQQTSTTGAQGTNTAIAQQTSTPGAPATFTAIAQQTATSGAGATLTAIAQGTATSDPSQATATAIAQQTATTGAGATSTPDPAQATNTAIAQQTATAGAGATPTAMPQATSTPDDAQATATTIVEQTATAGAGATATAVAQASATATPSGPYVTTTVDNGALYVGDKTLLTVTMHNTPFDGYASAEFTCTYDPALVETSNFIITNLFGADPAVITISPQAGAVVIGIAGSHGNRATTSGVAFTFEAKALQAGQTTINCTARISKGDGILTPLPSTGSALVILGPGPSPTPSPNVTAQPGASPTPTTSPFGSLNGQVIAYKPVTISVYDANNNPVASIPANPDGTFSITIPAGTYWVVATAGGYLPAQGSFTVTGNAVTTLPTIALPAGDIDGNNVIDQFDAMTIGMSYNTNVPAAADLNNDGVINVLDLDLLASNYRKTGPVVWQ